MSTAPSSPLADDSAPSYIIIGAGVFGVSTAYHLIRKHPAASVTLIDRDAYDAASRVAASWDWNKVIRADYDNLLYCRLGLEAQEVFESDELWRPFFHRTGIYWMCRSESYARHVLENHVKLGRGGAGHLAAVPVEEAKKLYGGLFEQADYSNVKEVLVNARSGWAAAADCLTAVTKECIRLGVRYVVGEAKHLIIDSDGTACRCTGVNLSLLAGEKSKGECALRGTHIILSTGAYTPKLLELSAAHSSCPALAAGERIVAGGITTGMTKLDEESFPRFKDMPVGVQGYTAKTGPFIGSLPPTPARELKWWGQKIFRHTQEVLPGRRLSAPPAATQYSQWEVGSGLRHDVLNASRVFYGEKQTASWTLDKYRVCWDAFTPSADFIISPHPAAANLYVATCGNFHGWKFFPVIGKYVVQMLEGKLELELSRKWAWDRELPDPALNPDFPRWEMNDLMVDSNDGRCSDDGQSGARCFEGGQSDARCSDGG